MTDTEHGKKTTPDSTESLREEIRFLRDLLEKREEALREARSNGEHLYAILEYAPDLLMRFDDKGRHIFVNRAIESVAGIPAETFIGKTHRDLGFDETICRFWEKRFARVLKHGDPMEGEAPFSGIHGKRIFNWRLIPEYGSSGKVESMLCLARDITVQRRAEKDYAQLFAAMPYGLALHQMVLDKAGKPVDYVFLSVNPAFEKLTGLKAAKITGKGVKEVLPDTEREWILRYARVALGGEAIHFESFTRALGKHFEVTAYPSGPGQFATLFHDITPRKCVEEEREKLKGMLAQAQKMNAIGRLAGGVAHDFNNKLAVITGYAEFALEMTEPSTSLHQDLQEILKASRSAADLTRQLLTFARKEKVHPRILDINASLETMLAMLRRLIGEHIALSWQPGTDLWHIRMDPGQLDQIMANLCINARDAIGASGQIVIETRNASLDAMLCAMDPDLAPGDFVRITVSDNGCGMEKEVLSHIFEPFFTTKGAHEGTGLGLATVYGIVRQNQGLIRVYSEPGQGSEFSIFLPRHREEAPDGLPAEAEGKPAGGRETLLLVEDEPGLLALNAAMLRRLGYEVVTAGLPDEALEAAEKHKDALALVITDVIMPEMSGTELARRLKTRYPGIRILFMSGYAQALISGEDPGNPEIFLHKPFSFKELALKVRQALDA